MGTIMREGGGCREDDAGSAVVDAEKEDGEAYGGESDVCDRTSGDDTVGEDRFEVDLAGHVVSLALSLMAGLSSLELSRRKPPLADGTGDTDLVADAVADPNSVPELPTVQLPEAEGFVRVRVEDSLEDGEPEEGTLAGCDISEDVRERLGRGTFGSGSVGGRELAPDAT